VSSEAPSAGKATAGDNRTTENGRERIMATPTCRNCLYSHWDPCAWLVTVGMGWPQGPTCANHPDSLGRMRPTPAGGVCRNYRPRPPEPVEGAKQIPLADGVYAYVDASDYEWLSRYNWRLQNGYAARRDKARTSYMHREIARPPKGMTVDHINHNKLDNTRINLRVCTHQQNVHNNAKHAGSSSRFKGVGYNREKHKWFAKAYFEGKRIWLGYFDDETEAARAYDAKAVELFGEFAHLNFPEEWPPERRAEVYTQRDAAKREGKKVRRSEDRRATTPEGRKRPKRTTHNTPRKTKRR